MTAGCVLGAVALQCNLAFDLTSVVNLAFPSVGQPLLLMDLWLQADQLCHAAHAAFEKHHSHALVFQLVLLQTDLSITD